MTDPKKQFMVRLDKSLVERMETLTAKLGYSSANEFAAKMLNQYAELLAELELTAREEARRHHEQWIKELIESLRKSD